MKFFKLKEGFTLLEVVVALGLLILIFGSVVSLAILTREAEQASKNNLIAAYLAKEGQDLVRYRRDKNYLDAVSAFNSLVAEEVNNSVYYFYIDYTNSIRSASANDVQSSVPLKYFESFYGNGNDGENTIFKRLVTTTYHEAAGLMPAYIDVKVEVYWKSDTKQDTYTLNSQLSDWN
ncbi:MAG: type II secretion system protein [Candidatus Falkowbacteria bacterium]|nr:type II secretion system protein [Candidatus Falkowbacteria bacterium]